MITVCKLLIMLEHTGIATMISAGEVVCQQLCFLKSTYYYVDLLYSNGS